MAWPTVAFLLVFFSFRFRSVLRRASTVLRAGLYETTQNKSEDKTGFIFFLIVLAFCGGGFLSQVFLRQEQGVGVVLAPLDGLREVDVLPVVRLSSHFFSPRRKERDEKRAMQELRRGHCGYVVERR